jgi:hypothetical protein
MRPYHKPAVSDIGEDSIAWNKPTLDACKLKDAIKACHSDRFLTHSIKRC